ncbi:MAG: AI-2E family transporter [Trueperaceae bacterium]
MSVQRDDTESNEERTVLREPEADATRQHAGTTNAAPDPAMGGRAAGAHDLPALQVVWDNVWVRSVSYVGGALFLAYALWRFRSGYAFALEVGVIGFIIAYVLNPLVGAMMRLRIRRGFAVALVYLLLLLVLAFGSVVVSQVVIETGRFVTLVPAGFESLTATIGSMQRWFAGWLERLPDFLGNAGGAVEDGSAIADQVQEQIVAFLQQLGASLADFLEQLIQGGPGMLLSGATAVISTTFQIALILIAGAYFLYDFPRFAAAFRRVIPVRHRPLVSDLMEKADVAVGGYLRGQLLITLMLGVLIWIGLTILGVPLATAIAFVAAVFNLIPYLGPIIGVIPAVLLAFTVGPWTALLTAAVFLVANQIEGNVLSPLILSRSTNLHPITVMLAIITGLGLLGLLGALLAVPTVALVKVVLEEYLLTRPAFRDVPPPLVADELGSDEA